jgi:hypothetical protein
MTSHAAPPPWYTDPVAADELERPLEERSPEERFYCGHILRLSPGRQSGVVRSASGKDIPFTFAFVEMLGERRRFEELHVGTRIGYDVSWTSRGLRVSVMRILD